MSATAVSNVAERVLAARRRSVALVPAEPVELDAPITGGEMEVLYRLAKGLAASGMFKDARQADQAFAKLIFGRDLGLSATQAMTDVHIVEGKPELSANLQAAKVRSSGRYDYRVLELTAEKCAIQFGPAPAPARDDEGAWLPWPGAFGTSDFTMADAANAALAGKNNWKHYPRNMLFARAMSNGVAFYCPDVTNGIRVYAEGELRDTIKTQDTPIAAETPVEPIRDAEVVEIDPHALTDEERDGLSTVIAGLADDTLQTLLTSVGVDCTDDLTKATLPEFRQRLADHMIGGES